MEFQEQITDTHPGKGLETIRLVRVSNLGLVAGLLALLLVAAVACRGEESEATAESSNPSLASPSASARAQPTASVDDTWVLELLDGRPLIEESVITLRIDGNHLVGIDGCNHYGWRNDDGTPIAGADGVLQIPGFDRTDQGCEEPEGVMDQADLYGSALLEAQRYRVEGDRLEIIDGLGTVRLVFKRDAPLEGSSINLAGTAWRVMAEGETGRGIPVPTIAFLDDRLATGVTACRPHAATFSLFEGSVNSMSTSMFEYDWSCPEEARQQKGEFTEFLMWTWKHSVYEEEGSRRLEMRSARGKTLVFEPLPPAVENIADVEWALGTFIELRQGDRVPLHSPVVEGTAVTISFHEDGISGSLGCNSYFAPARIEDGSIVIDALPLLHTEKTCEGTHGLVQQEDRYLGLMPRLARYGIYGDSLFMQTDDGVFLLFQAE